MKNSRRLGRNSLCPCGSGAKYKNCHLGRKEPLRIKEVDSKLSLKDRSLILAEECADILGLTRGRTWDDVRERMNADHVRNIYKVVAALRKPSTDFKSLLPHPSPILRALYVGDIQPGQIERNILRLLLYVDQVLYVDPFLNPYGMREQFNPIENPQEFTQDTLKLVYGLLQMLPLIQNDRVLLVPDPAEFDRSLFQYKMETFSAYRKNPPPFSEASFEHVKGNALADFSRYIASLPPEQLPSFVETSVPGLSDVERRNIINAFLELRESDPLTLKTSGSNLCSQMQFMRGGTSDELSIWLCQETGAFPYTDVPSKWQRFKDLNPDPDSTWTPLTQAFQSLEFKFLNNVTPKFAERIRAEGRLEPLRQLLRDIWRQSKKSQHEGASHNQILEFRDRLIHEHNKAEAEYAKIDSDLGVWLGGGASVGALQGALTSGALSPMWSVGGFAVAGLAKLWKSYRDRQGFRRSVPMSVFVDLSRTRRD